MQRRRMESMTRQGLRSGPFGLLDPRAVDVVSEAYDGDIYNLALAGGLPRHRPAPDGQGALLLTDGFAMPGGQDYATGAHHHEPFRLGMWSAAGAQQCDQVRRRIAFCYLAGSHLGRRRQRPPLLL